MTHYKFRFQLRQLTRLPLILGLAINVFGCVQAPEQSQSNPLEEEPETALQSLDAVALAEAYAPIIFHDTMFQGKCVKCDYITNFDYDGDYVGKNNWDNLAEFATHAYVYYSVSETRSHYFIGYYFFHPRDFDTDSHENDLEGMMLAVNKQTSLPEHMVTLAHDYFYQYTNAVATTGSDNIDGTIALASLDGGNHGAVVPYGNHPTIFIEDGGHGVFGCGTYVGSDGYGTVGSQVTCDPSKTPGHNGLVFAFKTMAEVPGTTSLVDGYDLPNGTGDFDLAHPVGYQLIAVDSRGVGDGIIGQKSAERQGLWTLQNHICDNCVFTNYGTMRGDTSTKASIDAAVPACPPNGTVGGPCSGNSCSGCIWGGSNKAKAPWGWDSGSDGESFVGDLICDPALLFDVQLNDLGTFSRTYVNHRYWTHKFQGLAVTALSDQDGGSGSDPYLYVTASGQATGTSAVLDDRAWKRDNLKPIGSVATFRYGGDNATGQTQYGDTFSEHYFCRQTKSHSFAVDGHIVDSRNGGPDVVFSAIDSDGGGGGKGDLMVKFTLSATSKDGTCRAADGTSLDDDSYSPNSEPNDNLPLITLYDATCPGANKNSNAFLSLKMTRVKRPDVRSAGSCRTQAAGGTSCGQIAESGDCYCSDDCRGYGDCCADKISVCGANWQF